MRTVQIKINDNIAERAMEYAKQKGINLSTTIENFLSRITKEREEEMADIPDVIQSLLGAGELVDENDLNGRKAYYSYLSEKHQ